MILLIGILPSGLCGQYFYDFETGGTEDWIQNAAGRWDTSALSAISGAKSLKHIFNSEVSGVDVIARFMGDWQPDSAVTRWQWRLRHGYDPSSGNRWTVWLVADKDITLPAGRTSATGYALGVNATGSTDLIELYKVTNGSFTSMATTTVNWQTMVGIAAAPLLEVRYDTIGQWQIWVSISGKADSLLLKGSVPGNPVVQPGYFGIEYQYSATQDMKLWVDEISISGLFTIDSIAPSVVEVFAPRGNQLVFTLSEPVAGRWLTNTTNYLLNDTIHPFAVEYVPTGNSVLLTFTESVPDGVEQSLVIDSLADQKGNVSRSTRLQWTYTYWKFHDVLISEVLPDPDPPVDLPVFEFVELANQSADTIYFDGWSIKLGSRSYALEGLAMPPDSFAILCHPDAVADYSDFGKAFGVIGSLTALTNTSLAIGLYDNDNQLIDSIQYTSTEYTATDKAAGGWSLERINPDSLCGAGSWITSVNVHGGTPGMTNSVYFEPDTASPVLRSIQLISDSLLILLFDELPVAEFLSFHLNDKLLSIIQLKESGQSLHCYFNAGTFPPDSMLYMSIENVSDACGNTTSCSRLLAPYFIPQAGQLRIFEIMADPDPSVGMPEAEYIEVHSLTSDTIKLEGCSVVINGVSKPLTGRINPGDYAIICHESKANLFTSFGNVLPVAAMPSLTNSSATITLINNQQEIIDSLTYYNQWITNNEKREGGWSLERTGAEGRCGTPDWQASVNVHGGTPGMANSVYFEPDTVAPVLMQATLLSDSCMLLDFDDSPVVRGLQYVTPDTVLIPQSFTINGRSLGMYFRSGTFGPGVSHSGRVYGITDACGNSCMVNVGFPAYYIPQNGQVIINEVLFNPRTGGVDFVEIINRADQSFRISELALTTVSGTLVELEPLVTYTDTIPPMSVLAFTEDSIVLQLHYPAACSENVRQVAELPSLPDDAGGVALYYIPTGILLDRFEYTDNLHSAFLDEKEGVSLERLITKSGDHTWHSASETAGYATPGCENSASEEALTGELLSLSSDIISPDADGHQDVVEICLTTGQPGWVAKIDIYALSGQLIRKLTDEILLSPTDCFTWDGTGERGDVSATGIYLINLEMAGPEGQKVQEIRPLSLISR